MNDMVDLLLRFLSTHELNFQINFNLSLIEKDSNNNHSHEKPDLNGYERVDAWGYDLSGDSDSDTLGFK